MFNHTEALMIPPIWLYPSIPTYLLGNIIIDKYPLQLRILQRLKFQICYILAFFITKKNIYNCYNNMVKIGLILRKSKIVIKQ